MNTKLLINYFYSDLKLLKIQRLFFYKQLKIEFGRTLLGTQKTPKVGRFQNNF